VDAALDEANNERFNLLLRDFEIDSQFIVITHSKRTMSMAQMLFGITMQQQGVSKRIAVRFDDYDETAAACRIRATPCVAWISKPPVQVIRA
jgi:chromosome segregation protein